MIDSSFKLEDYEDEMRDLANVLIDFMEKVSIMYYTMGYIEGQNLNKKEERVIKEKKTAGKAKVKKVMEEYKAGQLHSGSKKGPKVKSRKQAIAIAMSESGQSIKKKGKK